MGTVDSEDKWVLIDNGDPTMKTVFCLLTLDSMIVLQMMLQQQI